ncbi:hypothetical protein D3C71_1836370 [compost metagenome]
MRIPRRIPITMFSHFSLIQAFIFFNVPTMKSTMLSMEAVVILPSSTTNAGTLGSPANTEILPIAVLAMLTASGSMLSMDDTQVSISMAVTTAPTMLRISLISERITAWSISFC